MALAAKLLWKARRLRAMDPAEIVWRVGQQAAAALEQRGIGLARPSTPRAGGGACWLATLPRDIDPAPYVAAAERILAGRFDVFALKDAALGFPPRWNVDPKTGHVAPDRFGKAIDYRDEREVGDVKYLWEPSRHLQLVTLAQAWHLTRERRFADGCRTLLASWFDQCPYPQGIHWTSALEAAIRLVNWSFAWHLLGGDDGEVFADDAGRAFRARWLTCVHQHCHFVAGYLSRHSSANNHLLGELTGLLVGAATWPRWPESERWLAQARREFEEQALAQTAPDGVNREQAFYYQHEVMDMMLVGGLVSRAAGRELPPPFWERLSRMMEFVASMMDCAGRLPAVGDSDDALLVRFSQQPDFDPFRSLLATGAVMFGRPSWKPQAGGCDDKTRWLLGDDARAAFDALPVVPVQAPTRAFPDGGYYLLGRDRGTPREIHAVVDCGPLGYLSIAAHGHADALSLLLSAGGRQMLVDPGTFAYHTQQKWRDHFRSTAAHNTVSVDGLDQSVSGGNFLWLRKAGARATAVELDRPLQRFAGEHDGYSHLSDPVTHRRVISFDTADTLFIVEDSIEALTDHRIRVAWQFSEHCQVSIEDGTVLAVNGPVRVTMSTDDPDFVPQILCGQDDPPAGWVSRAFDVKTPAPCVAWSATKRGACRLVTRVRVEFVRQPAATAQAVE